MLLAGSRALRAEDGLYFTSPTNTGRSATNDKGETISVGEKAGIEIINAHIHSEDNANSTFQVALNTSDFRIDPQKVALCVGGSAYIPNGWGSTGGHTNSIEFVVHGESKAKAVAKSLSVDCPLRSPPGYKYLTQFIPTQKEFQTNEPVIVKLEIKNLDDRPFLFQHGGQQRGARDSQYGFRAMFGAKPVMDVGEPMNFGGLWNLKSVEPGETFEGKVDLRKWFAFDQPGNYFIHGFYQLAFYPPPKSGESPMPWNLMWADYASADFEVVIK